MPRLAWIIGAVLLTGCAARHDTAGLVAPPPVVATMPRPPAGAAVTFQLPARAVDGRWQTPNRNLSPAGSVWHLRSALNVAALGCRDAGEPVRVAAYNALLARHAAAFAAANKALSAEYRTAAGTRWQDAQDDAMTRLYNFWAQPPVQPQLCTAADAVLADASLLQPGGLDGFAPAALARMEAPFLGFYDQYQGYQLALAAWQAGRAVPAQPAPVSLAAAVPSLAVDPAVFRDSVVTR